MAHKSKSNGKKVSHYFSEEAAHSGADTSDSDVDSIDRAPKRSRGVPTGGVPAGSTSARKSGGAGSFRARAIAFTLFDPTEQEYEHLIRSCTIPDGATESGERLDYAVFQEERCPTTGRIHIQGYLHRNLDATLSAWKRIIGADRVHIARARGDAQANRTYCTKEASRLRGPWEFGTPTGMEEN